jgi:assimilatory nitrate reductase catalytic subunit
MDGANLPETRSTCPYCGVGCGVLLRPNGEGGLDVRGDPDHPANLGQLCSKGRALGETLGQEQRLLAPKVHGQDSDWDNALDLVARRFRDAIDQHGPDSVAFYVSGQLLTEDYYVANKLMKGFIGSANIDTNSRLCMASSVAGHRRAFGADTVPGTYEDIDQADLVVLVGSNLAWCHPVLYQRLLRARKARGTKIIVVDPRRTASCDRADLHLALQPGSDVALFNRLFTAIHDGGAYDAEFVTHTQGYDETLITAYAEDGSATGLSEAEITQFCDMWLAHEKVVTIYSQGVNQSSSGTDKVNAILNCHLATGRIGRPGCGPFSVTGQPNAMGGREVGGLANMLACHLDLDNPAHRNAVQAYWGAPRMADKPGLKAVDLFRAVGDGRIKALWIIHTNPVVSMPDADAVRDAIAGCPFTVVSDVTQATDTARLAHVVLPVKGWAEKDGTVTNSDRTISRQRAVLPAPGQGRADWDILADVARRMGYERGFDYETPAQIFREYAVLSGTAGALGRDFDISSLGVLSDEGYDTLAPARWPLTPQRQGGRFFADGTFFHADSKAKLIPVKHQPPAARTGPRYPFRLNTGRLRDQWHTMTRTGLSARLSAHLPEPFVEIHPDDAQEQGIVVSDLVQLRGPTGACILRARITDTVQRGQLFAPIHWTGETAPSARIDVAIPGVTDPISGQPESKAGVAIAQKWEAAWYGFAVSREAMTLDCEYWARVPTNAGYRAELAGLALIEDWESYARQVFGSEAAKASVMQDSARGTARVVLEDAHGLLGALFVSPQPVALARDYLAGLPGQSAAGALSGRSPADLPDPGPILCACMGVGVNTITDAIHAQKLSTVEAVGQALQAGTGCGSCQAEIAALLPLTLPQSQREDEPV